ncbi:hypothetical protein [Streptomyces sp. A1547]|uniref:hypothetical protein n=1 Tax=Streptomyces sp. A1547 TaxID=2563105 RepID=UPI00109EA256|nr:hypothetical protein [Streptomyces sp. A1547]THA38156.1 hypothetical protein E6W17_16875 [Streptomyces sp. A1547]
MINDIHKMRNVNLPLFSTTEVGNALHEYDPDAQKLVARAARALDFARTGQEDDAAQEADDLTRSATAELLRAAGGSVSVRFALMITARLVELEADLIQARATSRGESGIEGRS